MDTFIIDSSESNRTLAIAKRITEAASRKVWCVLSLNLISTSYGWTVRSFVFPKTIVVNTHDQQIEAIAVGLSVQKMDSNAMEEDCLVRREKI